MSLSDELTQYTLEEIALLVAAAAYGCDPYNIGNPRKLSEETKSDLRGTILGRLPLIEEQVLATKDVLWKALYKQQQPRRLLQEPVSNEGEKFEFVLGQLTPAVIRQLWQSDRQLRDKILSLKADFETGVTKETSYLYDTPLIMYADTWFTRNTTPDTKEQLHAVLSADYPSILTARIKFPGATHFTGVNTTYIGSSLVNKAFRNVAEWMNRQGLDRLTTEHWEAIIGRTASADETRSARFFDTTGYTLLTATHPARMPERAAAHIQAIRESDFSQIYEIDEVRNSYGKADEFQRIKITARPLDVLGVMTNHETEVPYESAEIQIMSVDEFIGRFSISDRNHAAYVQRRNRTYKDSNGTERNFTGTQVEWNDFASKEFSLYPN